MRRLRLPWKFALIALVLVTPFAIVAKSYIAAQDSQASFASGEQVGITAIRPMITLLGTVDAARSTAARGGAVPVANVQAAAGVVDATVSRLSSQIDLTGPWTNVKTSIGSAAARTPATGSASVGAWSAVSNSLVSLIAAAADKSKLTLDPVLDTYYLQDALTVKIPSLLDAGGAGADLAAVDSTRNHDAIAIANGTASSTMAALAIDLQKAVQSTSGGQLGPAVLSPLSALRSSTGKLTATLGHVAAGGVPPSSDLAAAARRDAVVLAGAVAPQLDRLLSSHIAGFRNSEHFIELVAALALALALWLFVGFFRSMTESVNQLVEVLSAVESGDLSKRASTSGDEVGQMGVALNRMRERMNEMVDGIAQTSVTLSSASEELSSVSREMSTAAEQTADRAGSVSAAAEQVSGSVQSVSVGTEEMGASINEIAKQASDAARVATDAVAKAETTNSLVQRLGENSGEIDEVIKIISSIAKQTNMLALNATIEAARAGDAGRGFAVVAGEVKELARDTARSSEKIERNIEAIQADTRQAVVAIGEITSIIHHINDIQTIIAAAVEEQAATTNEMARSVNEAAAGSGAITRSITGVADTAKDTTRGAADTSRSAQELARLSTELLSLTRQFRLDGDDKPDRPPLPPGPIAINGTGNLSVIDPELATVASNGHR